MKRPMRAMMTADQRRSPLDDGCRELELVYACRPPPPTLPKYLYARRRVFPLTRKVATLISEVQRREAPSKP